MGVRGIELAEGDSVISLAILRHMRGERRRARGLSSRCAAPSRASPRSRRRRPSPSRRAPRRAPATRPSRRERYAEMSARRAVHPHGLREWLRQAHVVLRVPRHRPRRQGHRAMAVNDAQRQARGLLPGGGERPDHAGHRWRPADPLPGRRHPHRRAARRRASSSSTPPRTRRSSPSSASARTRTASRTAPRRMGTGTARRQPIRLASTPGRGKAARSARCEPR